MKKTTIKNFFKGGVIAMSVLSAASLNAQFEGDWKFTPKAGAMGVGPSLGDISWWSNSDAEVTGIRACQFDDVYHFESDGTFQNRLGTQTYVEGWQGGNGCGSPAAPHDGSKNGKWIYNSSNKTIMIIGKGSFLGIPKVYTGGELTAPAGAKDTITYTVTSLTSTTVVLDVPIANGAYWRFELTKETPAIDPTGNWNLAPKAGCIKVGPSKGDYSWWGLPAGDLATRACQMDDRFVFNADGTFQNILGTETWREGWQGADGCGAPVAPHDGSASAKWSVNKDNSSIMIVGKGAYIGIPKAYNGGELSAPSGAKDTIIYPAIINKDTMIVEIAIANGAHWYFELVRSAAPVSSVAKFTNGVKVYPNPTATSINIELENNTAVQRVEVLNTVGMRVMEVSEFNKEINVSALSAGTYFLNVTTANGVSTSKFIKQ
jgi:hypothetical protein